VPWTGDCWSQSPTIIKWTPPRTDFIDLQKPQAFAQANIDISSIMIILTTANFKMPSLNGFLIGSVSAIDHLNKECKVWTQTVRAAFCLN
jgi:hypothetical protein